MSDERPDVWVGHISQKVSDPARSAAFYEAIGMRPVHQADDIAILELRGGTHIVLEADPAGSGPPANFDLMVDDVDASWTRWRDAGHTVSDIRRGRIHDSFELTDPDGAVIAVHSSHVIGPV